MIGLIIDTESWLREFRGAISHDIQGQEGDTTLDTLWHLVEDGTVRIVLSTRVIEEWNRHREDPKRDYRNTIKRAVGFARSLSDFLSDDASGMLNFLLQAERFDDKQVLEVVERRAQTVEELLAHTSTARLEVSDAAKLRAVEAALNKEAPFHGRNSMADALILFGALEHVRSEKYDTVYFVSNNSTDFADKANKDHIHPDLAALFEENGVQYFRYLALALREVPDSLVDEEVIAEAEREQERERFLEQMMSLNQILSVQAIDTSGLYQPQALLDAINPIIERDSENIRRVAETLQSSQAFLDAINSITAMTEQNRENMRRIAEALQSSQAFLDAISSANAMTEQIRENMKSFTDVTQPQLSLNLKSLDAPSQHDKSKHDEEE